MMWKPEGLTQAVAGWNVLTIGPRAAKEINSQLPQISSVTGRVINRVRP